MAETHWTWNALEQGQRQCQMGPTRLYEGGTPCGVAPRGRGPAEDSLASRWTVEAGRQMRAPPLVLECTWPFYSLVLEESPSSLSTGSATDGPLAFSCHAELDMKTAPSHRER